MRFRELAVYGTRIRAVEASAELQAVASVANNNCVALRSYLASCQATPRTQSEHSQNPTIRTYHCISWPHLFRCS